MPETGVGGFPSCYGGGGGGGSDEGSSIGDAPPKALSKNRMGTVASLYQTKLAGQCRIVTIAWSKNLVGGSLSVTIDDDRRYVVKVDIRPWLFWKTKGSRFVVVNDCRVYVYYDVTTAKYEGPEPTEGYYVAIVCDDEVVLVVGDYKDAARRLGKFRPASIEATLVSRREHLFGKKCFVTRSQFCEGGQAHEIMIECGTSKKGDPKLSIRVDWKPALVVKRLMWKFRGHRTIVVDGQPVEVFWDVHDWFFDPPANRGSTSEGYIGDPSGYRGGSGVEGIFMFQTCSSKPWLKVQRQVQRKTESMEKEAQSPIGFTLFLHTWKSD